MSLWKKLLRLLIVAILTPVIFLLGCQSKLIYYPNPYRAEYETMLRTAKGVRLAFSTDQGKQTAFYIPPRRITNDLPETVWVCFAGNGSLALDWLSFTDVWSDNFAYLLVDYPSYGDCAGKPSPKTIRESSLAAVEALTKHLDTTQQILQPHLAVMGHSLGSAAALLTAEALDVRRGVLISPFTTMTDMGRIVLGWPLCHLNLHRFDNRKALNQIASRDDAHLVIFHGSEDEVIPVRMGRELAAEHPQKVTYIEVSDARHNDILALSVDRIGQAMQQVVNKTKP